MGNRKIQSIRIKDVDLKKLHIRLNEILMEEDCVVDVLYVQDTINYSIWHNFFIITEIQY